MAHPRESPYGPVTAELLACGCPVYMTRDELQNQQNIHNQAFPPCSAKVKNTNTGSGHKGGSLNPADILASCQIDSLPVSASNTLVRNSNNNSGSSPNDHMVIGPDMLPFSERQLLVNGTMRPSVSAANKDSQQNNSSVSHTGPKGATSTINSAVIHNRKPSLHSTFKPLSSPRDAIESPPMANNNNNNRNANNRSNSSVGNTTEKQDNDCNNLIYSSKIRTAASMATSNPVSPTSGDGFDPSGKDSVQTAGFNATERGQISRLLLKQGSSGSEEKSDSEAAAFMPKH